MTTLSKGTRFALLCIGLIFALGVFYTIKDYTEHQDLSAIWWPVIAAVLFGLTLWRGARTDGRITILLPLLLAAGSCARPGTTASADAKAERERPDTAVVTYTNAQGFEEPVTKH